MVCTRPLSAPYSLMTRARFGSGRELAVPDEKRLAVAEILEGHGLRELHRLDVFTAAVAIDDAFGRTISSKIMRF